MRPPKTALLAPLASILATVQLVQALKFITPKELILGQEVTIEWIGQPSLGTIEQAVVLIKNEVPLLILCQGLITGSGKCTFTLSNSDGQSFIGDGYHLGLRASDGLVLDVSKPFNIKGNPKDKDTKRAKNDKKKDKDKAKDKDKDKDEDDDRDDKDDDRDEDDDDDNDEDDRDDDEDDDEVRIQSKKHKGKQHKHDDDDDDDKEDEDQDRDEDEVNAVENMKIHKHSVGSAAEMNAPQSLDATQHQVSLQYIDDSQGLVIASVGNPARQKLERPFPRRVRPRKTFTPPLRKRFTKYRALVEARRQERVMAARADKAAPSKMGADDLLVSIDPVTIKGLHGNVEVMPSQNEKEHNAKGAGADKKEHGKKKHFGDDSTNGALGKKEHEKSRKESKHHPATNKDGDKSSRGKTGDQHGSHASKKMIEVEEAEKKVEPKTVTWGQWFENVGTAISSGLDRIKQTFSDKHPDQQRTDTKERGHRRDEKSDKEKRAQTQETLQRGSLGEDL
ncbi:hypothetical protein BGW38_002855 [Lunasporangiospora selenospora]|uniref:Nucleoplasmin-like domain-containing protein n=1 Tax=Lunasporangiospora selenospora TaxID=979761 RepID=A0A9P6FSA4_9FUNG|nr:hypothetical protein BGW38_002855 [Lunasporangiospora selenospora]